MNKVLEITHLDGSKVSESQLMNETGLDSYGCHFQSIAMDEYGDLFVLDKCGNYADIDMTKYKVGYLIIPSKWKADK